MAKDCAHGRILSIWHDTLSPLSLTLLENKNGGFLPNKDVRIAELWYGHFHDFSIKKRSGISARILSHPRSLCRHVRAALSADIFRKQSLLFTFAKGFVSGAGFSLAVAVAIPLLVLFISQFDWVPVIGRFVGDVTTWLEMGAN
jgi:hypothetical protein